MVPLDVMAPPPVWSVVSPVPAAIEVTVPLGSSPDGTFTQAVPFEMSTSPSFASVGEVTVAMTFTVHPLLEDAAAGSAWSPVP